MDETFRVVTYVPFDVRERLGVTASSEQRSVAKMAAILLDEALTARAKKVKR